MKLLKPFCESVTEGVAQRKEKEMEESDTSIARVPIKPTVAMLRPFMGCPDDELELAWNAMLAIVAAQYRRAAEAPK